MYFTKRDWISLIFLYPKYPESDDLEISLPKIAKIDKPKSIRNVPNITLFKAGQATAISGIFVGTKFKNRESVVNKLYRASKSLLADSNLKVIIQIGTNFTFSNVPSNKTPYAGTGMNFGQVMNARAEAVKNILTDKFKFPEGQIQINDTPAYNKGKTKFFLRFDNK